MGKNQNRGATERSEGAGHETLGLSDDHLYRVLASRQRRRLLYYLDDVEASTVTELAEVLVGWETGQRGGMVTETDYDRMVIALRHSHLPMLADAGLLTYDEATGRVECEPVDDVIADLLARSVADETA
jgi:hypothetical protein